MSAGLTSMAPGKAPVLDLALLFSFGLTSGPTGIILNTDVRGNVCMSCGRTYRSVGILHLEFNKYVLQLESGDPDEPATKVFAYPRIPFQSFGVFMFWFLRTPYRRVFEPSPGYGWVSLDGPRIKWSVQVLR